LFGLTNAATDAVGSGVTLTTLLPALSAGAADDVVAGAVFFADEADGASLRCFSVSAFGFVQLPAKLAKRTTAKKWNFTEIASN
jgi:hypothetical protein